MTLPLLLALLGCKPDGEPTSSAWIQGASYGWELFNHRVSHVQWRVTDSGVEAAIIGGTSTTGVTPTLPAGCDEATCDELPFLDDSAVEVGWVTAEDSEIAFTEGSATLLVGAGGAETSVALTLPAHAEGDSFPLIRGLTLDTDQPLTGGEACYNPAYGWHPRRIAVALGTPVPDDGGGVLVPVSAHFEAGESLEEIRACIDDVNDQAQVQLTVDLVLVTTPGAWADVDVSHGATYAYGDGPASPDEQPEPDPAKRPLGVDLVDPLVGWSALDWRFHVDDAEGRGAYLRTLSFQADAQADLASGHATNYSPITQLTGFDYSFSGTVYAFEPGEATTASGTVAATIPAELDAAEEPVVHALGW